jgi:hypothetical protein
LTTNKRPARGPGPQLLIEAAMNEFEIMAMREVAEKMVFCYSYEQFEHKLPAVVFA